MEGTGKFMIILYDNGEAMSKLNDKEREQHMRNWYEWTNQLQEDGIYESGHPYSMEARTVSGKSAKVSEGFFTDDRKYVLGGYYVLKGLDSIDAAAEAIKECPIFELDGNIEIRELMNMPEEVR